LLDWPWVLRKRWWGRWVYFILHKHDSLRSSAQSIMYRGQAEVQSIIIKILTSDLKNLTFFILPSAVRTLRTWRNAVSDKHVHTVRPLITYIHTVHPYIANETIE
jgi:hypothetical protein